jgi:gamma-glutamyltranspeptidase/glutathione hydrolase
LLVFEPSTGTATYCGGSFAPPAAEQGGFDEESRQGGRTIMMPGWVNGAHAAWRKWGSLAWADLFDDALHHAREGFVVDQLLWGWMFEYRRVAARYPAGEAVWQPGGYWPAVGDVLKQSDLARTIEGVRGAALEADRDGTELSV